MGSEAPIIVTAIDAGAGAVAATGIGAAGRVQPHRP